MYNRTTTIVNKTGLHARPASEFVKAASKFKSTINISKKGLDKKANAKSILFIMSMGMTEGTEVIIEAEGEDEKEAVDTLVELIDSGFGE